MVIKLFIVTLKIKIKYLHDCSLNINPNQTLIKINDGHIMQNKTDQNQTNKTHFYIYNVQRGWLCNVKFYYKIM